jgi:hypothetical protein
MDAKDKLLVPFRDISTPVLILLTLIVQSIFSISTTSVARMYGISLSANFPPFKSIWEEFFTVIIFAPLVETLIFQYFLVNLSISLTRFLFKREYIILAIMMPAMAFGLAHTYNCIYMASTFVTGLLFNTFYMVVKYRKQDAYSCTTIVHGLYNLFIFGLKHT